MSFMGKIDSNTQYVGGDDGDQKEINHGASAKENLEAAGKNVVKTFTPDKIASCVDMIRNPGGGDIGAGIGMALGVLALPWAVAADVLDVAVQPLLMVKNLADAAIHGVIAGFKKIF